MLAWMPLRIAFHALARNKVRSTLMVLGMAIGVGAVIATLAIGQGAANTIARQIQQMGNSVVLVHPGSATSTGVRYGSGSVFTLTPDDAEAIRRDCPEVVEEAPTVRARTQVIYGDRNWAPMFIWGTTPTYLSVRGWTIAEGDCFSVDDVQAGAKVCVIGQTLVDNLFNGGVALGQTVRVNNVPLRVVGILAPKGANMLGMDQDDILLIPWTTVRRRITQQRATSSVSNSVSAGVNPGAAASTAGIRSGSVASSTASPAGTAASNGAASTGPTGTASSLGGTLGSSTLASPDGAVPVLPPHLDEIELSVAGPDLVPAAMQDVTELLHERHRIRPNDPDDFHLHDITEVVHAFQESSRVMTALLAGAAAVSLLVGGVGVMNIMLVSVSERTREIGIRLAVGARGRDVLRQFLAEAVLLALFGGMVGVAAGCAGSLLIASWAGWPTLISAASIAIALGFSIAVGLFFGYYPALRAARLDPIQCLRYE